MTLHPSYSSSKGRLLGSVWTPKPMDILWGTRINALGLPYPPGLIAGRKTSYSIVSGGENYSSLL